MDKARDGSRAEVREHGESLNLTGAGFDLVVSSRWGDECEGRIGEWMRIIREEEDDGIEKQRVTWSGDIFI